MKKTLCNLVILCFMTISTIMFTACSSDEPVNESSLNGTVWESFGEEDGFSYKSTIYFYESTYRISAYEEFDGEKNESTSSGTYIYKHPDVTLIDDDYPQYPDNFKISGNKLGVGNDIVWTRK